MKPFKHFNLLKFFYWASCFCAISLTSLAQNQPQVIDIYKESTNSSYPSELTNIGNRLIFNANSSGKGKEPHLSDGTAAGTFLVRDIFVGTNTSNAREFTALQIGNKTYAYYFANNQGNSGALFSTNIANGFTSFIANVNPSNSASSTPGAGNGQFLVNVNGTLFFSGQDPLGRQELFKSDGTTAGTVLVKDINTNKIGGFTMPSNPEKLTNINGRLFFTADADFTGGAAPVNRELWVSDGTAAGTYLVKDIYTGGSSNPNNLVLKDGLCYFFAYDGFNMSLWSSDGTTAGTRKVWLPSGVKIDRSAGLVVANNLLYFVATDATRGKELWYSDGQVMMPTDVYPGAQSSNPHHLTNVGGVCYFVATSSAGAELWKSNGTSTVLVKDIQSGAFGSSPKNLTAVKAQVNGQPTNLLYFTAFTAANGRELWKSDGTSAGTTLVKDLNPSATSNSSQISEIAAVPLLTNRDEVFMNGFDGDNNIGTELWHTNASTITPPVPRTVPSICGSGAAVVKVDGAIAGQKYRWYLSASGGSVLKESTNHYDNTFTTFVLTASRNYYVSILGADGRSESQRVLVPVNVVALPSFTIDGKTVACPAEVASYTANLDISSASNAYQWNVTNGEIISGAGTNQVMVRWGRDDASSKLTLTVTNAASCEVTVEQSITMKAFAAPPTAISKTRCGNGNVTLTATKADGTTLKAGEKFRWYTAADSDTPLTSTTGTFTVFNLSGSANMYVSFYNGLCESTRVKVTAYALTYLVAPTVDNLNICGTGRLALTASNNAPTNVQYRWYDAPTGGTILQQNTAPEYIVNVSTTTTYYVSVYNEECGLESERTALTVTHAPLNGGIIEQNQVIQVGYRPALILSKEDASGGFGYVSYSWQSSEDGIVWQTLSWAEDRDYRPGILTQTTYFRRVASSAECGSVESNMIKIDVVPRLKVPTFESELKTIAGNQVVQLTWINNDDRTDGYYLEKGDGTTFNTLATLTVSEQDYVDSESASGGKVYYRLRAFKGSLVSRYVEIAVAVNGAEPLGGAEATVGTQTLIYPNPVGELANIKVNLPENGQGTMILRNNAGKAVLQYPFSKTSNNEVFTLQLAAVKSGIYWLEIIIKDKKITKRIIKK